jgi:hypothetical protein
MLMIFNALCLVETIQAFRKHVIYSLFLLIDPTHDDCVSESDIYRLT